MAEDLGGFQWPIRVYWEDTDAGGIVFYANYLKFFERARTEWLRHLGVEQQRLRDEIGGMFVVTDTQVRYQRPARLDDFLLVTARVLDAGRASLTIGQSAYWQAPSTRAPAEAPSSAIAPKVGQRDPASAGLVLLCTGTIRIGWVDAATLRPQRIPASVLNALGITS
ncbi:YbgC/FadM family acyl-CoA thioesterase [Hydrogenophaga sp.]|uniref:YbgC/FadM family acyl-CoA thioesterase n=1 Tax=Hydrogenophaga sp. TaxID=1904254 RepID=UPI002718DA2E|nr:YbgC/FadM family acyl-CoA thioesterase [Hydrogenophaga sp.]MDO8903733.1 YbgC/FadM family acyl-CoA thioesterase [Hydrogenophaga sp.]